MSQLENTRSYPVSGGSGGRGGVNDDGSYLLDQVSVVQTVQTNVALQSAFIPSAS